MTNDTPMYLWPWRRYVQSQSANKGSLNKMDPTKKNKGKPRCSQRVAVSASYKAPTMLLV